MQKRGQVTIFIILGIILAAMLILAVLYRQDIILTQLKGAQVEAEAELPVEKEILQALQGCIDEKATEAVELAGMQGGYITIPEDPIQQGPNNPFSNALTVTGSMRVPYWFYETANGLQKSQIPDIKTTQDQLSEYVKEEAAKCAPEVASRYDISSSEEDISVETLIKDNSVTFTITYPTTIQSETIKVTTGRLVSVVNLPLGRFLGYAKAVDASEETFLEDRTIDMLVLYDELPYSGTEFSCASRLWTKPKVAEDFKAIAAENIPNIRLAGSENEAENGYFNWDAISPRNTRANFLYSTSWPTQIEIEPSEGQLLKGDELNQQVGNEAAAFLNSLFCLTNYHFIYNIKYPVLASLADTNTGFTLQYATQVIIKSNQPRERKIVPEDASIEPEICKDKTARATVSTLQVMPDNILQPVGDVEIKYKCSSTACPIGKTDENGELTESFPQCYNGFVIASKQGLLTEKQIFSTNEESEISLLMDQVRTIPFEIIVTDNGQERSLGSDEQATIQLTEADKDYMTSVSQEQTTIDLVPGDYQMKSTLIQAGGFEIQFPKQTIEHCAKAPIPILGILGFTSTKCTTTDIPPASLTQAIKGGATADWELDIADLGGASKITFYIPAQKTPSNYDELTAVYNSIQTATAKEPLLE